MPKRGSIDQGEENWFEIRKISFEKVQKLEANVENQCGTCKSVVGRNQKGVLCDACECWFHSLCIKLSAEDYKIMAKPSSKVTWFCESCKEKMKDVYSEMSNLKQENKMLRSENMMLKDELRKLESKFDEFRDCVAIGRNKEADYE